MYTNTIKNNDENIFTKLKTQLVMGASIFFVKLHQMFNLAKTEEGEESFIQKINNKNSFILIAGILLPLIILFIIWNLVFNKEKGKNSKFSEEENSMKLNKNKEITLPNKDIEEFNSKKENQNSDESVILLKGRTKKIPRSLNYNELFVNNNFDKEFNNNSKSANKKKQDTQVNEYNNLNLNLKENAQEKIEEENNSNFEDFFDKINENKKVLEILNQAKNGENK